jgi:CBS domain-containing protein
MKVLVATDGSACAKGALAFAGRLLPLAELEVVVVSVAPLPSPFLCGAPTSLGPMPDVYYGELLELAVREAHEALRGAREVLGALGVKPKLVARQGDAVGEILEVATVERPDLIVLGSHGRGFLGRALLGSVSQGVLHRWQGAVMVIRQAEVCAPPAAAGPTATPVPAPKAVLRQVMSAKLVTITDDAPLRVAARALAESDIGALPVLRDGHLIGILTDRDLVVRGMAHDLDAAIATVGQLCTHAPAVGSPEMPVAEAVKLMEDRKIRRLPVLEDGRLVGMVSLGDLAETMPRRAQAVLVEISKSPRTLAHGQEG